MSRKYEDFVNIVRRLRKDCPWDRVQTHKSIRQHLIEEAYEVVEAIDDNNMDELKKELGDILLHVVFHSVIAEENGKFQIDEVISLISDKLIRRHPHVFGETTVSGGEEVKRNWERIKMEEGRKSALDGIPKSLPALGYALRLQEKASKAGFDWDKAEDCRVKVDEEIEELKEAVDTGAGIDSVENEFGDLLFSLVNYARFIKINPEDALRKTNKKFIRRFQTIERILNERGKSLEDTSLEEMDEIWNSTKLNE